jgi:2-polyprenyl-6-methoxyphenol hydroxylase-like FAD-dependent oxidoreductase
MTIPATLGLEQASGHCWDVIVIGGGPAGSLAARQLARMGKSVLLVDKLHFPRWKVCGCCVNSRALSILRAAGLSGLAERHQAVPLQFIELATQKSRAVLPLNGGVALSREALDAALVEAAIEAGAAFLPGVLAFLGADLGTARCVFLCQGKDRWETTTRLVLAATGLGSTGLGGEESLAAVVEPGSRIGAGVIARSVPTFYRAGVIYMACASGGYLGLVQREDRQLNLAAALDVAFVRESGGLGQAAALILSQAGWPAVPELSELAWRGTPGLTRRAHRLAAPRVLVLGDAAGYVEPFTGEGIGWALAAGAAVAPLARRAVECWKPELAEKWTALHAFLVNQDQRLCRWVMRVLRRPSLFHLCTAAVAHAPGLAGPFLRRLERRPGVVPDVLIRDS